MIKKTLKLLALLLVLFNTNIPPPTSYEAYARAGGGHSSSGSRGGGGRSYGGGGKRYGGGSSSSGNSQRYSGSGGSLNSSTFNGGFSYNSSGGFFDAFSILRIIIQLHFKFPLFFLIFDGIILLIILTKIYQNNNKINFSSTNIKEVSNSSGILKVDKNFSEVVFLDFVYALYAKFHELRGEKKLSNLSFYINKELLQKYTSKSTYLSGINGVVISSAQISNTTNLEDSIVIEVDFHANYTEINNSGKETGYYSHEIWTFTRKIGVLSKTPEQSSVNNCPSCGAGTETDPNGACTNCGTAVKAGNFDWFVQNIYELERTEKGPNLITHEDDIGVNYPTVISPNLNKAIKNLSTKDPNFSLANFNDRVKATFLSIQQAWTTQNWTLARPYETDNLFQTHLYWISEYKKRGYTNVLEQINLQHIVLSRVGSDAFFDFITVRIMATMIDYTKENKSGIILGGSKSNSRKFTEYWTFIRRKNAEKNLNSSNNCPSCGAKLNISMTGICEYCGNKITTGTFDWVLTKIEQDDDY